MKINRELWIILLNFVLFISLEAEKHVPLKMPEYNIKPETGRSHFSEKTITSTALDSDPTKKQAPVSVSLQRDAGKEKEGNVRVQEAKNQQQKEQATRLERIEKEVGAIDVIVKDLSSSDRSSLKQILEKKKQSYEEALKLIPEYASSEEEKANLKKMADGNYLKELQIMKDKVEKDPKAFIAANVASEKSKKNVEERSAAEAREKAEKVAQEEADRLAKEKADRKKAQVSTELAGTPEKTERDSSSPKAPRVSTPEKRTFEDLIRELKTSGGRGAEQAKLLELEKERVMNNLSSSYAKILEKNPNNQKRQEQLQKVELEKSNQKLAELHGKAEKFASTAVQEVRTPVGTKQFAQEKRSKTSNERAAEKVSTENQAKLALLFSKKDNISQQIGAIKKDLLINQQRALTREEKKLDKASKLLDRKLKLRQSLPGASSGANEAWYMKEQGKMLKKYDALYSQALTAPESLGKKKGRVSRVKNIFKRKK